MPSLAPELVLQILEAASCSSSPNPEITLSNAALVCSLWRPLAQEVLFRAVNLTRTPESRISAVRTAPGILLAASGPSHALRSAGTEARSPSTRLSQLRALTAAAAPTLPTPRSQRATQALINALEIDSSNPSARALCLSSLVRSLHVFVTQPDQTMTCQCNDNAHFGGICSNPCSIASPLSTGAVTERHLAVLLRRLPQLQNAHIVLDRVNSFSPLVTETLRANATISSLSVHVLKRPYTRSSPNANNLIGFATHSNPPPAEDSLDNAMFQLIHALAPNLDTLVLEGELPRDPPVDASSREARSHRPSIAGSPGWNEVEDIAAEPAPDCSLRQLIWRGRLPPSPALLAWLLSAKAQGVAPAQRKSRLEVLEMCSLPPPDQLAEVLREHVPTLRSLRLHYFEAGHVNVVRQLLGRDAPLAPPKLDKLHELVLHRDCAVAPDMLRAVEAKHVAVIRPCIKTLDVLEGAGQCGFQRVTVVGGDRKANERVRIACETNGVAFESVGALTSVW